MTYTLPFAQFTMDCGSLTKCALHNVSMLKDADVQGRFSVGNEGRQVQVLKSRGNHIVLLVDPTKSEKVRRNKSTFRWKTEVEDR